MKVNCKPQSFESDKRNDSIKKKKKTADITSIRYIISSEIKLKIFSSEMH